MRLLITSLLVFLVVPVYAEELVGKVVGVRDGDTITVLVGERDMVTIRLEGIDSPEQKQSIGVQARLFTRDAALGKKVKVNLVGKDKYGRSLGVVFLPDGTNLNLTIVSNGYAWHYSEYNNDPALIEAQIQAQKWRKGLWAEFNPIPPWEFRKEHEVLESTWPVLLQPTPVPSEEKPILQKRKPLPSSVSVGSMSNRDLLKLPLSVDIMDPVPPPPPRSASSGWSPSIPYSSPQYYAPVPFYDSGVGYYPTHHHTEWNRVHGYFRRDGTFVGPHMRRTR